MMLMQFPLRWTCRPDPEERPSVWPNNPKPWHGTDDPLFSRKAPVRKLVRFSLTSTPIPLPKKRQHLFLFSEHDRTKMPIATNAVPPVCLGTLGEGWSRGRGSLYIWWCPLPSVCHPAGYLGARRASLGQSNRLGSDCTLFTMLIGSKVRKSGCTRKNGFPLLL